MPAYRYRAVHASGRIHQGNFTAANENELAQHLTLSGFELIEAHVRTTNRSIIKFMPQGRTQSFAQQRIMLCSQLEDLLRAGVPFMEAFKHIASAMPQGMVRDTAQEIMRDIHHGESIASAFSKQHHLFGSVEQAILTSGENSGDLVTTFAQLVQHLRWQAAIQSQLRRALRYPLFLLCVAIGVTIFMMTMVVPQVSDFLISINDHLPLLTRMLIATSHFFSTAWWMGLFFLGLGSAVVLMARRYSDTLALLCDTVLLRLPGLGTVLHKLAIARFASSFGILLRNGVDLPSSLHIAKNVLGNRALLALATHAEATLQAGQPLSIATAQLFPAYVIQMLRIGEQSDTMTKTLDEMKRYYDNEVSITVEKFIGSLEPVLTLLVGALLAWVVLAVLGPVYDSLGKLVQTP